MTAKITIEIPWDVYHVLSADGGMSLGDAPTRFDVSLLDNTWARLAFRYSDLNRESPSVVYEGFARIAFQSQLNRIAYVDVGLDPDPESTGDVTACLGCAVSDLMRCSDQWVGDNRKWPWPDGTIPLVRILHARQTALLLYSERLAIAQAVLALQPVPWQLELP